MKGRTLSVISSAILAVSLLFSISACGTKQATSTQEQSKQSVTTAAATDTGKVYTLKAATNNPKVSGMYKGMEMFKEIVEKKTNGRVVVELYADGVLGDEEQLAEGMQLGTVDFTIHSAAKYANFVPEMDIYSPPYTFKSWDHMKDVIKSDVNAKLVDLVKQKRGDYYVGVYADGLRNIFTREPVKTLADMKGMKLRTMTGPNETNSFKALGMNPTPLAYTELYAALQSGVVDGAENTMTSILGMKFYESCKYILSTGHNFLPLPVVVSGKFIEKLPEDLRELVLQSAIESCDQQVDWAIAYDLDNMKVLQEKYGVTISEFSKEDLNKAIEMVTPVLKENAARLKMEKDLEIIQKLAEKY